MSKYSSGNLFTSIGFAIRGILLATRSQRNFRIDLIIGISAIIAAVLLKFSSVEMAVLLMITALVLFSELLNTVIEFVIDAYFGHRYSILAKMSKDIAAGGVLLVVIFAVLIGLLLFLPKIIHLIIRLF